MVGTERRPAELEGHARIRYDCYGDSRAPSGVDLRLVLLSIILLEFKYIDLFYADYALREIFIKDRRSSRMQKDTVIQKKKKKIKQ